MSSTNITQTQIELLNSSTADIHICGQCKTHFTSIGGFVQHKEIGCTPAPNTPSELTTVSSSAPVGPTTPKKSKKRLHKNKDVQSKITSPEVNVAPVSGSGHQQANDAESLASSSSLSPSRGRKKSSSQQSTPQASPFQAGTPLTEKRYKCNNEGCDFTTRHLKDMQRHIRIHTGEKPYGCKYCEKCFSRQDKLKIHHRIHVGDKPFQCNQCSYCCVDGGSLKKHLRIHNDERPFKCQICEYRSRSSSQLIVHLRTHTGDTPFHCQECDSKFKINSDLTRHMRIHSGEKPFKCMECEYRSSLKSNLNQHMKTNHADDKRFQCEECGFSCCTKHQMKQHSHSHATTQPIKCLECSFQCFNKVVFRRHERKHSEERPYKCQYCNFDSKYPGHVPAHIKKCHPETIKVKKRSSRKSGIKLKIKMPPTASGPDGSFQVVSKKPFQCDSCEANFMRQDSLFSHLRQHERLNTATSRESMDRESTATGLLQLQYSGVNPETQSTSYAGSTPTMKEIPSKPAGILNTLLTAIESTDQSNTRSGQRKPDAEMTTSTVQELMSAHLPEQEVLEVVFASTDATSEVEVSSDKNQDGNRIREVQNPVMIIQSKSSIDHNTETVTLELQEEVLAQITSSSSMASNSQTPVSVVSSSSTKTLVNPTASGDRSYPEVSQGSSTAYYQLVEPQSIPRTGAVATGSPVTSVRSKQAQATPNNANLQVTEASPSVTTPQQVFNLQLPQQFLTQHAGDAAATQQQGIQLVTSELQVMPGAQTSTNVTASGMINVAQPVAVTHPSTILLQQQQQIGTSITPIMHARQSAKHTQQQQRQTQSQQQQTLIIQQGQQHIPLTFALPKQQQQQQVQSSVQQTDTTLEWVTFPEPTSAVTSSSSSEIQQQQQEPIHTQPSQSSSDTGGGPVSKDGQPEKM